jgi:hypothetical protein
MEKIIASHLRGLLGAFPYRMASFMKAKQDLSHPNEIKYLGGVPSPQGLNV